MADAGRILIMPKGTYDSVIPYEKLDLIKHNDSVWLAKKDSIGIEPSDANEEYWFRMTSGANASTLGGYSAEEFVKGVSPYFASGETILDWANNPNGVYRKFVLAGNGHPSDAPATVEGWCDLFVDEQKARRVVRFTQFGEGDNPTQYMRSSWNGAWREDWFCPFIPSTGGTLSGNLNVSGGDLTIRKTDNGRADFYKNHSDTADYGLVIRDINANEENVALYLKVNTDKVEFRNKAGNTYEILHTDNSTADKVKAGILGGKVQANHTAQATLNTAQLRNIYIGTVTEGATSSLPEGTIVFSKE